MTPTQNTEIVYRSTPLPKQLYEVLTSSGRYTPEMVRLLMLGLPISSGDGTVSVIEYPDGRRIQVQQLDEYDSDGRFLRFRFEVVRTLLPANR